jgi:hypothetical protein
VHVVLSSGAAQKKLRDGEILKQTGDPPVRSPAPSDACQRFIIAIYLALRRSLGNSSGNWLLSPSDTNSQPRFFRPGVACDISRDILRISVEELDYALAASG